MLCEFHLKNFVLIEEARLQFLPGLNIISGETGAGKSLIASALGAVLGNQRFHSGQIRKECDSASLTAVFELPEDLLVQLETLLEIDLSSARSEGLILERRLPREGRGRSSINGRPVPLSTLRQAGVFLLDMAAQDEHSALRDPAQQRHSLDLFGKLEIPGERVANSCRQLLTLVKELQGGESLRRKREEEISLLHYQLQELKEIEPDARADQNLEGHVALLANYDRIQRFCSSAVEQLYESDPSVCGLLSNLCTEAEDLASTVPALSESSCALQEGLTALEECARSLRGVLHTVEANPEELNELRERLMRLKDLARKYSCEPQDLENIQQQLQEKCDLLSSSLLDVASIQAAAKEAMTAYLQASSLLTQARKEASLSLSSAVKSHLNRLGMERAEFDIRFIPPPAVPSDPATLAKLATPWGLDEVCYVIRPNPGEEWGTLSATASGGEATRIMLAVKSSLAEVIPCDVLFFDEIDAGVGGRLGEAIANQLLELSKNRQIIAITHLPQIASCGNHHLCVRKVTQGQRTLTTIVPLEGETRVQEIAQMIRGSKSNETTLSQAREMLASSSPFHENT